MPSVNMSPAEGPATLPVSNEIVSGSFGLGCNVMF